jgi:dipeptidase
MTRLRTLFTAVALLASGVALACTNLIVTRGASTDGSIIVSYAADSHQLYGALYKYNAPKKGYPKGSYMPVYDWDSDRYMGQIKQAERTYSTVGNMNEHSLIITETTFGGRPELEDSTGIMDYGSLIYITLQRAKTAREAIDVIVSLTEEYGYASSGESFTIADANEVWIMELIGKGCKLNERGDNINNGIVYVARRVPDGYVSAHANHSRISTFPKNDPENCVYADDVISFAREAGLYEGSDDDFSFCDTYAPADFMALRGCEARVWSFFRMVADGMDQYLDYAMGHNPKNRMPLWVKPRAKVSAKVVFDAMRDHYEGTPMDMTKDVGAGGNGSFVDIFLSLMLEAHRSPSVWKGISAGSDISCHVHRGALIMVAHHVCNILYADLS